MIVAYQSLIFFRPLEKDIIEELADREKRIVNLIFLYITYSKLYNLQLDKPESLGDKYIDVDLKDILLMSKI